MRDVREPENSRNKLTTRNGGRILHLQKMLDYISGQLATGDAEDVNELEEREKIYMKQLKQELRIG